MERSAEAARLPLAVASADVVVHDGFTDVVTTSRPLDVRFDPESALAMRTGCGALGWRFRRLDASAQQDLRARVVPQLAELGPDALVDRSEVLLTSARRTG